MRGFTSTLALPLFSKEQSPSEILKEILGRPPIPHSVVRKHKRQAIREACTPRQTWHRKVGLAAIFACLAIFVGLMVVSTQFTVPTAYNEVIGYAIMASFIGIAFSWMYRDSFHPGRWEIHPFSLYASSERRLPDDTQRLEHRVRESLPGGQPEIHRHGKDPFLAFVVRWWIFSRTYFIVEFDDKGIVAN